MEPLNLAALSAAWEPTLATVVLPFAVKGVSALAVLLIAMAIADRVRTATLRSLGRTKADPNHAVFVGRIAHLSTVIVGLLIALGILGVSWTALLAVVGAISLAISLAIQDVLKNFVAGLYLLIERPFRVGETIKIKDFVGKVEDIGIRTTVLRTEDAMQVMVPNAIVFTDVVVNLANHKRQEVRPGSNGDESAAAETPAANRP